MNTWKTLKIFVSSTFLDLELERDQLADVFHRTKQNIATRQLSLIPYDLRWRPKHSREPLVRWCMDMVRQCDYFVSILGYRYGWRPPQDERGQPNLSKISITEMEVNQALATIPKERRLFCILHREKDRQQALQNEREEDRHAIEMLKQRIKKSGETVFECHNATQLVQHIEEQLRYNIDRDYPPQKTVQLASYTRKQALQEVVDQKCKGFVGRSRYLQLIQEFVVSNSTANILALHAVAGTGKSSVLAKTIRDWQRSTPLISHFVGFDNHSRTVNEIMLHLAEQLKEHKFIDEEIAEEPTELKNQVRLALENASKRLVVLIDGLDEVEEAGQSLHWLPRQLPVHVRVVVSTRPVQTLQIVSSFANATLQELPPLGASEISQLIQDYVRDYQLNLSSEDEQLLQKRADGNPLYLKVALEEIISSGIAVGQLANSIESLFGQIIERLSTQYGAELIRDYIGLIAGSRSGLAEGELLELILEKDPKKKKSIDNVLLGVARSLENFIIQRGGILHFFHAEFERTIKERIGRKEMRNYHQRLGEYFARKSFAYQRSLREICYQYQWAEEHVRWLETLANIDFLEAKSIAGWVDDLSEDFALALRHPAMPLRHDTRTELYSGVPVAVSTLRLLNKALSLDLRFVRRNPHLIFQCLWNRCYWYDAPETLTYLENPNYPDAPWKQAGDKIYKLVEAWHQHKLATGKFAWVKSRRPLEPNLDSPLLKVFQAHEKEITSVAWSETERRIVSGARDSLVRVFDYEGDSTCEIAEHKENVRCVAFRPDGKIFASGGEDWMLYLWHSESGECSNILDGHQGAVTSLCWSSDGKQLVSGCEDGCVYLWDVATAKCLRKYQKHNEAVLSVAQSKDGKWLISGGKDQTVRIWECATGNCLYVCQGHERMVLGVAFHPDGKWAASACKDHTIRVWDTQSGQCLVTLRGHENSVNTIVFTKDGKYLISGADDSTVRIWQCATWATHRVFSKDAWQVTSMALDEQDTVLFCGAKNGSVSLWRLALNDKITVDLKKLRIKNHTAPIWEYTFDTERKKIATVGEDSAIRLWDIQTASPYKILNGHELTVSSVAWSSDDKRIVSGGEDSTVRLWNAHSGDCLQILRGHRGMVAKVYFHRQDSQIISIGFFDNTIRVWHAQRGECLHVLQGHERWIQCSLISKDEKFLLTGSRDKTMRLWDLEAATMLKPALSHESSVTSVAISPDQSLVASGSYSGIVRIWDRERRELRLILHGHKDSVIALAFTNDGKQLISTCRSRTTRVWDVLSGECVRVMLGQSTVEEAAATQPMFSMVENWETVVMDKNTQTPAWQFQEPIEPVHLVNNYLIGKGHGKSNYLYFVTLVGK